MTMSIASFLLAKAYFQPLSVAPRKDCTTCGFSAITFSEVMIGSAGLATPKSSGRISTRSSSFTRLFSVTSVL